MTYALDITEGQPEGHAMRTCLIGMGVGRVLGIGPQESSDLYYALLLKDLGCSSNSAKIRHIFGADDLRVKRAFKTTDLDRVSQGARFVLTNAGSGTPLVSRLKHVIDVSLGRQGGQAGLIQVRCERGADIAHQMGFSEVTAAAIRSLDERWDGNGYPYRVAGEKIPLLGRMLCLAQTVEVFFREGSPQQACLVARERAGTWFDPEVVAAFELAQSDEQFWLDLDDSGLEARVLALESREMVLGASDAQLDRVAEAFARVIDAKSPWTYRHSERVQQLALGAAAELAGPEALSDDQLRRLSRAALLHDLGKLGVSNLILDKPGRLTDEEFALIRRHPAHSELILARVEPFRELAPLAGGHHERMDGRGYHNAISAGTLAFEVRLLAVAGQFEALTAPRPYRDGMTPEAALELLRRDVGEGVDPVALDALARFLTTPEAAPLLVTQEPDPQVPIPAN
ncbi:MAG: HD domain-containing phosphohydrolase [Trueperaceae bacterium]